MGEKLLSGVWFFSECLLSQRDSLEPGHKNQPIMASSIISNHQQKLTDCMLLLWQIWGKSECFKCISLKFKVIQFPLILQCNEKEYSHLVWFTCCTVIEIYIRVVWVERVLKDCIAPNPSPWTGTFSLEQVTHKAPSYLALITVISRI